MRTIISISLFICVLFSLVYVTTAGAAPTRADRGEWAAYVSYAVADTVTYQGCTYSVIQAHTSLPGWEPPNVPALFQLVGCGGSPSNTPTRTNTPVGATNTPTRTNTPPAATNTPTRTNTPAGATNTPTRTNTPVGATNTPTRTNTPPAPTNTPTATSGSGGSCSGVPQYVAGTAYTAGQIVQNVGNRYICNIAGWCSSSAAWAYAPGTGTYWTDAWSLVGPCDSGPTATPTVPGPTLTPSRTPTPGGSSGTLPTHALIGYWHNFDNGSGFIPLRNVSTKWDLIIVAFGEPTNGATNGTIGFTPYPSYYTSGSMFASDVAYLHSIGKKVLISIGGANGLVQLTTTGARDNFVNSVNSIISTYGFDGLDVDFENQSLVLNAGDNDPTAPTTPVIVNTIAAIRSIQSHFGSNFILTMAPETFFVQLGYSFYGGTCSGCDRRAGAFLPVIYATRDILTVLHVQDYNSGPITGLDNAYHTMGGADFHIAMLDMLLAGFPVAGTGKTFPALRADQVALGIPATANAGNGYVAPSTVQQALDYIIKGIPTGSYVKHSANATAFRGVMTWSINWDAYSGFPFSNSYRTYLDGLP